MPRVKRVLGFGFLLMGLGFTVTQGLLIRELLVAFFGNELSIGLILGNWLILEAIGSGLLGRLADRWKWMPSIRGSTSAFAALQVAFALFLPLCLYAAYASRRIVGAIPGEGVGLVSISYASALILTPLALVDGAMFAFGCRAYAALTGDEAPAIGRVYVYEALGAIAGGIVFTYLLIPFLHSLRIVLLLSTLNLFSAALLLASASSATYDTPASSTPAGGAPAGRWLRIRPGLSAVLVLLVASLGFLLFLRMEAVQRWAAGQQWPGYDLLYSRNSPYGNVAVVQREAQYTFFADGIPILTAPVPDVALSEEIVHLPMLFLPQPRRALVLSGGVGGVLHELAKYPVQEIDYAELDPLLIEAATKFPTPLTRSELEDPRVHVERVDGRLLVGRKGEEERKGGEGEEGGEGYDLIIVNLPYPSTLQLNRFYTVEFFRLVRRLLAERGVLVIGCPGTLTYMSDELRDLNAMLSCTLREAFSYVRPVPGDLTLWLASPSDALVTAPLETLVRRWEERGLEAQLVTPFHIRLRLDQGRLDWFRASLEREEGVKINRDLHPAGLFYGLSYWNALFSPRLARVYASIGRLNVWVLGLAILGCGLLFLVVARLAAVERGIVVPVAIATTGFTGMAADLVIVFAFQSLYGYVYHWIGLLVTAFMGGLSLGGLRMTRKLPAVRRGRSALLQLEGAIVLYWVLLPVILNALYARVAHPLTFAAIQGLLLLLNAAAGFLVGSQFPLANRMWLKGRGAQEGTAGVLYACDLVGAFVGSIVVSVALIPVLGIVETCLLAAVLKSVSLVLVATLVPQT
jgi:spermidine synthase